MANVYELRIARFDRFGAGAIFCFMLTAENAENAEMTEREKLDSITDSIIGDSIDQFQRQSTQEWNHQNGEQLS
ncbi:MAG: hypothetical protein ISS70_03705 [Phycisphaerae bacterium]|nr:hypothetical protein [Phycisphaerae bacterium]